MKIFTKIEDTNKDAARVVTIGNFDGMHEGHKLLIEKVVQLSLENNLKSSVITFNKQSLNKVLKKNISIIIAEEDKTSLIENAGSDELFLLEFNEKIMLTKCEDFLLTLKNKLNMSHLVLGFDAKIGSDQKNVSDISNLCKKNNILFSIVEELKIDGTKVSSTKIRTLIKEGKFDDEIVRNLGRDYKIKGKIIHGDNRGEKIFGYPTANIDVSLPFTIPKNGVYYCKIKIDDLEYDCAVNVGIKPTIINKKMKFSIEAHIYDFDKDIYNFNVELIFKKFIRPEIKFLDYEELKKQISIDVKEINKIRQI